MHAGKCGKQVYCRAVLLWMTHDDILMLSQMLQTFPEQSSGRMQHIDCPCMRIWGWRGWICCAVAADQRQQQQLQQ